MKVRITNAVGTKVFKNVFHIFLCNVYTLAVTRQAALVAGTEGNKENNELIF